MAGAYSFAVFLKPVELGARADPLTGEVVSDPLSSGLSPADEAALEWALRCKEAFGGSVRAVALGDDATFQVLAAAGAAGADELVTIEADPSWPSEWVAHALSRHVEGASLLWCGDVSADRGSGAVPAFLAAETGFSQALGLVEIELAQAGSNKEPSLLATRRLDGGRRERLSVRAPAVCSCEGATARLRRAPLHRLLAAEQAVPTNATGEPGPTAAPRIEGVAPFRPPAGYVAPPAGESARERVEVLLGASFSKRAAEPRRAAPDEAARLIIEALEEWGEL